MAIKKENRPKAGFGKITISLASPDAILDRSYGEVLKPETINYRTYKPERDGLFCEKIFGPVKDYECYCGKYKRIRYKGIVCDRCGVEVTEKKVRRERIGHINLVVPVAHIWYFRSLPNKIGYLLGIPTKKLDMVVYYERYVVCQPGLKGNDGVQMHDLLTEEEYLDILDTLPKENQHLDDEDPNKFIAKMGGDALWFLLSRINLDNLSFDLRNKASNETSQQRKQEALKRLKVVVIGGTNQYVTIKWGFDFSTNYLSANALIPAQGIYEYGIAEYDVAEYSSGVALQTLSVAASGSGKIVQTGYEANINGAALSIQRIEIQSKDGKMS
jgi:DNA-directed RNA polymerase subunit beta'